MKGMNNFLHPDHNVVWGDEDEDGEECCGYCVEFQGQGGLVKARRIREYNDQKGGDTEVLLHVAVVHQVGPGLLQGVAHLAVS